MLIERNEAIIERAKHDAREFVHRQAKEIEAWGGKVKDTTSRSGGGTRRA